MQFGWLNLTGICILVVMMIPNLIFARRNYGMKSTDGNRICKPLLILEQVGRYGAMGLMFFPVWVWEFGFSSVQAFIVWAVLCVAMLLAYLICWGLYFHKPSAPVALWLAILPSAIFILRGVFLRHWLLAIFGFIFAIGHLSITWMNTHPKERP
ncbi:MAG: hypothetical protein PHE47_08580 [Oscillospiraceae bacterium]|nr:hypothetical protein [Oscillospiraceae bacterium]